MNIAKYINSRDVRNYLVEIDYQFDSLDAAWLIYQCKHISIKERHDAWKELVQTMQDTQIKARPGTVAWSSLHKLIEDYIDMEERLIEDFFAPKSNELFRIAGIYSAEARDCFVPEGVFEDFADCINAALDCCDSARNIYIEKIKINDSYFGESSTVCIRPDGTVLSISPDSIVLSEKDGSLMYESFMGLWFDFPTPFKTGDILYFPDNCGHIYEGPFVMQDIGNHQFLSNLRVKYAQKQSDAMDMTVSGIWMDERVGASWEVESNYMDVEYFRGSLEGTQRALIAISNHLKGEISDELMLKAYHEIMLQSYTHDMMPMNSTMEGLRLAGLK